MNSRSLEEETALFKIWEEDIIIPLDESLSNRNFSNIHIACSIPLGVDLIHEAAFGVYYDSSASEIEQNYI